MGTWRRGALSSHCSGWIFKHGALGSGPHHYLEHQMHTFTTDPPLEQLLSNSKDIQDKKRQPLPNVPLLASPCPSWSLSRAGELVDN